MDDLLLGKVICVEVLLVEMFGYVIDLCLMSQGCVIYLMEFDKYNEVLWSVVEMVMKKTLQQVYFLICEIRDMFKEKFERMKLYVNVGMIGYVDYGKMMLIVVLIKVMVQQYGGEVKGYDQIDNVLEERECGIIIVIVYVEYESDKCYYVYVDCLGYVDYVKNMIMGVVQMDGVILVVSVVDGLMLQICEYILFVCQVGVLYMVVYLNKVD